MKAKEDIPSGEEAQRQQLCYECPRRVVLGKDTGEEAGELERAGNWIAWPGARSSCGACGSRIGPINNSRVVYQGKKRTEGMETYLLASYSTCTQAPPGRFLVPNHPQPLARLLLALAAGTSSLFAPAAVLAGFLRQDVRSRCTLIPAELPASTSTCIPCMYTWYARLSV